MLQPRSQGPYLTPLKREDTPELEGTYQDLIGFLGFVPNTELTMARMPRTTKALIDFVLSIYGNSEVGQQLLMLCGLLASSSAGCMYCSTHNANAASDLGVDAQKIAAVWEFETHPIFDDRERAALNLAFKACQTPSAVEPEDFERMAPYFSETETAEILMAMCHFGIFNRFNDSIAATIEPTPLAFCKANLPSEHWQAGAHDDSSAG
ncbi:MAG: carboxymuconolactone decarboxylase family protein [Pseudomonadota bacterium]